MAISGVRVVVVVWLMVVLGCAMESLATVYTVGDSAGWAMSVDYTTWASDKKFKVGDSLVFNYGSSHTVDEVTSSDYGTCTVGNSINSYTSGPTTIALNTTGTHYFICGVIGHCSSGMKLSVSVTKDSAATAPSGSSPGTGGSSSTTPSGTNPTPKTGIPTSNIPVPASSATLSPFAAVVFGLIAFLFKLVIS